MARTELVRNYCDYVDSDPRAHPIQPARRLIPLDTFVTVSDLYDYSVCSYAADGRPMSGDERAREVAWIIFDNVYARNSGGRSPGNALKRRAETAGFVAKGGPRTPERARALWQGAVAQFGDPASALGAPVVTSVPAKRALENKIVAGSEKPGGPNAPVDGWALAAIRSTDAIWEESRESLVTGDAGYMVFYSPVRLRPKLMIVGANPGGGAESFDRKLALSVPTSHDYFTYDYALARRMKELFRRMGHEDDLRNSVKLNLNFFRSRDQSEWKRNPAGSRRRLETFCEATVRDAIQRLEPSIVLAEGMATFDRLEALLGGQRKGPTITSASGARLLCCSQVDRARIVGIVHPTGFRVSGADWSLIEERLKAELEAV